jgi:hypothetical protein
MNSTLLPKILFINNVNTKVKASINPETSRFENSRIAKIYERLSGVLENNFIVQGV